jgi:hypothetical protein
MVPPETADVRPTSLNVTVVNSGIVAFLHPWNIPINTIAHTIAKKLKSFFMILYLQFNLFFVVILWKIKFVAL